MIFVFFLPNQAVNRTKRKRRKVGSGLTERKRRRRTVAGDGNGKSVPDGGGLWWRNYD
ncbi:hypothetical protein A2U01_0062218, partial [Trifolium medium]|nr:hypothetical protein [Trifolium medium]